MEIMEKTSCVVDNAQLEFFFDYNANGDLSEIHCSDGKYVSYEYDSNHRCIKMSYFEDAKSGSEKIETYSKYFKYGENGKVFSVECNFPLINGGIKSVETLTYNSLGKVCLYKNEQITGGKSTEDFSMSIEYDEEGDKRKIVSKNPDNEICILYQYWNHAEEKCLDSVLQCEYPKKNKLSGKASVKRFSKLFEDEGWDNNSVGEYLNDGFQIKDGNGRIVKRKTEYGLENMVYNQEGNCAFYSHLFTSEIDGKKVKNFKQLFTDYDEFSRIKRFEIKDYVDNKIESDRVFSFEYDKYGNCTSCISDGICYSIKYEYDIDSKLRHIVCSGIDPLICLQFLSWESKIEVMYNNYGNFIYGVFVNSDSQIKTDFSDVRKIFHIKTVYDFINRPIQTEKFDYKIEKGNHGHRLGDSFDTILMGFAQELVKEGVLKPEFWM